MSTILHVAACALNQTALDWAKNEAQLLECLSHAKSKGAQVICTPELSITGYGCEDAFFANETQKQSLQVLENLLPHTQGCLALFGLGFTIEGKLYNVMAVCLNKKLIGLVPKVYLAGEGVHYEPRWFSPWPLGSRRMITVFGKPVPFGDILFEVGGFRIGIEICRDAWMSNRKGYSLVARGAHLILNPNGSHFAFGKVHVREDIAYQTIEELKVAYIYTNLLGNDAGRILYDGDTRIATPSEFYYGPRLSFENYNVLDAAIDMQQIFESQAGSQKADDSIVVADFAFAALTTPSAPSLKPATWQKQSDWTLLRYEEFSHAVSLGLFDYLIKSKSHGFVINLSGGADSAACACLVYLMIKLGLQAHGLQGLHERLKHIPGISACTTEKALNARLLCCLYQGTVYSSDLTLGTAEVTAAGIGAQFLNWPVQEFVDTYCKTVETALDTSLEWGTHDLALQNIQARARGPAAWLVANMRNSILLSTCNRSEAAVGYTTMDGDTCGGLSPIAGVDKAFILQWLKWMEKTGPEGIGPLRFLSSVNALQPSAELRPTEQRDEDELMPYELMCMIETLCLKDRRSPLECWTQLCYEKALDLDREQLRAYVTLFYKLWCQNQWKRERYAPAFHLDDKNVDPKSWCRFPILSGNYEVELAELASAP